MTKPTAAANAASLPDEQNTYDHFTARCEVDQLRELVEAINLLLSDVVVGEEHDERLDRISALSFVAVDYGRWIVDGMDGKRS